MDEIRLGFHDILNKLNDITLRAGLVLETYAKEGCGSMGQDEITEKCKKAFEALEATEKAALEAGKDIEILMKKIYHIYGIDNTKAL